ncbi:MAG: tetratricopeptide repeat protein [Pseudomonadota bacterium]
MRVPTTGGHKFATIFVVAIVASCNMPFFPSSALSLVSQAQAAVDLQGLKFYPVPLGTQIAFAPEADMPAALSIQPEHSSMHTVGAPIKARYEQTMANIRDNEGPYAPALIGQLTALGQIYQQSNEHEEALRYLDQAAQISRTNFGLYGDDQIALTETMIDSLVALGRFDEVEDKYRFLVDVHEQRHGATVSQKAASLLKLGEWKLESFHRNLAKPDSGQMQSASLPLWKIGSQSVVNTKFEELSEAQLLFVDAVRQLIETGSWTDPTLFEVEQNLVRTFYIDANREQVIANPDSYSVSDESTRAQMRRKAATLELSEQYQKGAAAYGRMIGYLKKNPDATTTAISDVMLALADWHLLFGKQSEAEAQYQQLEKFLQLTLTPDEEAIAILQPDVPVSLPAFLDSPISAKPLDDMQFKGYVDFSFDVKRQGSVGKLEVLGSSEGTDSSITDRLVSLVRQARFRPSLGDVPTTAAVRYYYAY